MDNLGADNITNNNHYYYCVNPSDNIPIMPLMLPASLGTTTSSATITTTTTSSSHQNRNPNSSSRKKKKRTKFAAAAAASSSSSRMAGAQFVDAEPMNNNDNNKKHSGNRKKSRKPDPSAPKITRPCTECGKKFWSWKALFGHMRCHPERQWRGINPPPNLIRLRQPQLQQQQHYDDDDEDNNGQDHGDNSSAVTDEDHEVAACLLMLANGPSTKNPHDAAAAASIGGGGAGAVSHHDHIDHEDISGGGGQGQGRFECSSCKKVFGSHQALGGHRATHKNVKGCYAIAKHDDRDHHLDHDYIHNSNNNNKAEEASGDQLVLCLGTQQQQDDYINRNDDDITTHDDHINHHHHQMSSSSASIISRDHEMVSTMGAGGSSSYGAAHRCSICLRVFSSGQALGGHKRCHWDHHKAAADDQDPSPLFLSLQCPNPRGGFLSAGFDLNLPAAAFETRPPLLVDHLRPPHHRNAASTSTCCTNIPNCCASTTLGHLHSSHLDLRLGL